MYFAHHSLFEADPLKMIKPGTLVASPIRLEQQRVLVSAALRTSASPRQKEKHLIVR
jgi:hypothetical protein